MSKVSIEMDTRPVHPTRRIDDVALDREEAIKKT